ncbi:MAG: hypothetical protein JSW73_05515 [Candidatus Woesearchaeota archaeon]|nr:MAG: hypothetical protein JSW73_05515 [Candidatus Woesearchaeota archaeon]
MLRKIALSCLMLCVLLSISTGVLAVRSPLAIDSEIINDRIKSNETAEFVVFVENIKLQTDTIKIDHDFLNWQVTASPYFFEIPPRQTKAVSVRIAPPSNIEEGSYSLTLKFESKNYPETIKKHTLVVTVTENVKKDAVTMSLVLPSKSEPGAIDSILNIKNIRTTPLEDVSITISSQLLSEPYSFTIDELNPGEEKSIENKLTLLSKSAGNYGINVEVKRGGKILASKSYNLELYIPEEPEAMLSFRKESTGGFLKVEYKVVIENTGNKEAKKELKATFGSLEKYFVSSTPEPNVKNKVVGGEEFFWIYSVAPGGITVITYTVSYQKLFAAFIIIILVIIFAYFYLKEEVPISKSVLFTRTKEHKKYIKIMLQIKNNSKKPIHHLKVVDWIKTPLMLVEQFDTLKPNLIKKKEGKIKLTWDIPTLAPKEVKVISYGTKSKLKIIGNLRLPRAAVHYRKDKKTKEFWSSSPVIFGKE